MMSGWLFDISFIIGGGIRRFIVSFAEKMSSRLFLAGLLDALGAGV